MYIMADGFKVAVHLLRLYVMSDNGGGGGGIFVINNEHELEGRQPLS
jgi:predicted ABC-type sugar transport system permease subunit